MLKIICNNAICGSSFMFNDKKYPDATKVRCPKCKGTQPLNASGGSAAPPIEEEEDLDWLRPKEPANVSSPVITPSLNSQPQQEDALEEDFFSVQQTPAPIARTPVRKPRSAQPQGIGWLVIHDEYTDTYTFDLRKGINRIGRQSDSTPRDVNIAIHTKDKYMSRHHCNIEVQWLERENRHEYVLTDRNSSNGTFVNAGKRLSKRADVSLRDGDTIQAGRTKLVLKLPTSVQNSQAAQRSVEQADYLKTIIQ